MAPAPRGGRMGGCETHSADLRTHPASPTHPGHGSPQPAGSSSPPSDIDAAVTATLIGQTAYAIARSQPASQELAGASITVLMDGLRPQPPAQGNTDLPPRSWWLSVVAFPVQ